MKKTLVALVAAVCQWSLAQDTNFATRVVCEIENASGTSLRDLRWLQGSTPIVSIEPMRDGAPVAADTNMLVKMLVSDSPTGSTYAVTNAYLATNSSYYVQWGTFATNSCGTNAVTAKPWFYAVLFVKGGQLYWTGSGRVYVEKTTATGSNGVVWQAFAQTFTGLVVNGVAATVTNGTAYANVTAAESPDMTARESIVAVGRTATNAEGMAVAVFDNPYRFGGSPYRGQTHVHTTASDGSESAETMVAAYEAAGFDFVSITDHDGQPTANPGVSGILFIPGVEESAYRTDVDHNSSHVVSLGASSGVLPTNAQSTIDAILSQYAVPLIAHPSLTAIPWPTSILDRVIGYVGVEVYNGNVPPEDYYVGRWDSLLSKNVAAWGLAVDDAHRLSDVGNGWIVVYAEALTTNAVKAAIRRGSFYATQGPDIRHSVTGGTIHVATSNAASIVFYGRGGIALQSNANATMASYAPNGSELYVRAEVSRNSDGKRAWGQPFYIKERRDDGNKAFSVPGDFYAKRITTYDDMTVENNARIGGSFYGKDVATNSAGEYNFAAGDQAFANSTGIYNVAVGRRAMNTSTGNNVSAIGLGAGDRTIGNLNSFIGSGAGQLVRGGTNTALGSYAMYGSTGQVNVVLGNFVGYWSLLTNSVVIGNNVGKWARGVGQMFFDSYTNDFPNATYGPTNAVIYSDNGNLSLGRGGVLADGKANVLRGSWTAGTFAATEVSAITLKGETMDFYDPLSDDYCAVGVADRTLTFRGSPAIQHDDTDNAWIAKIQAGADRITFWTGTAAQYAALATTNATTIYFIRP